MPRSAYVVCLIDNKKVRKAGFQEFYPHSDPGESCTDHDDFEAVLIAVVHTVLLAYLGADARHLSPTA